MAVQNDIVSSDFFHAVYSEDYNRVKSCIERGDNVNARVGRIDEPLLNVAIQKNHNIAIAMLLIQGGADVNVRNALGHAPLHYAASKSRDFVKLLIDQNCTVMRLLIQVGADVNVPGYFDGFTPLHMAASKGNQAAVELLFENGADLTVKSHFRDTPYDLAASEKNSTEHVNVAKWLEKEPRKRLMCKISGADPKNPKSRPLLPTDLVGVITDYLLPQTKQQEASPKK